MKDQQLNSRKCCHASDGRTRSDRLQGNWCSGRREQLVLRTTDGRAPGQLVLRATGATGAQKQRGATGTQAGRRKDTPRSNWCSSASEQLVLRATDGRAWMRLRATGAQGDGWTRLDPSNGGVVNAGNSRQRLRLKIRPHLSGRNFPSHQY